MISDLCARITAFLIIALARFVTAVRGVWAEPPEPPAKDERRARVYFANHVSHGDFVLLWTVLPPALRARTRPVAGADYWQASALRRFIGGKVFRALMIARKPAAQDGKQAHPVARMAEALAQGDSLILFPEGTRNMGDTPLLPFKSGLYHLARAMPEVDLVPVWIDNLARVLPKGMHLPIPLICTVNFGPAIRRAPDEDKAAFLARAEAALHAQMPSRG